MDEDAKRRHVWVERERARLLRRSRWWQNQIRSNCRCTYCERPLSPGEATLDHRVPLSRGGRSTRGNVVPACKACNSAKTWRTPAELLLERGLDPPAEATPNMAAGHQAPRRPDSH